MQTAAAIAIASGAFAFLNGSAAPEMIAAAIGGGIGQWSRSWLLHRHLNHFAVATLTAVVASGVYVLIAAFADPLGLRIPRHPAGFISSVLFLVPGFPLIAGLFDLLQHQTVAALSRLAHGVMILLVVAFGLSIVIALAGVDLSPQPALQLPYALMLLLRAIASFAAGSAFAMLFNNSARVVLAVDLLAAVANELRLVLHDTGMMIAPAAFFGAVMVGPRRIGDGLSVQGTRGHPVGTGDHHHGARPVCVPNTGLAKSRRIGRRDASVCRVRFCDRCPGHGIGGRAVHDMALTAVLMLSTDG
jgi:uncharacterized membrane protein YjjP (DUF1212 family)